MYKLIYFSIICFLSLFFFSCSDKLEKTIQIHQDVRFVDKSYKDLRKKLLESNIFSPEEKSVLLQSDNFFYNISKELRSLPKSSISFGEIEWRYSLLKIHYNNVKRILFRHFDDFDSVTKEELILLNKKVEKLNREITSLFKNKEFKNLKKSVEILTLLVKISKRIIPLALKVL